MRLAFMLASATLHLFVSQQFYFPWVNNGQPNGIDGGPLGFLTWTIPAIIGTLACDLVTGCQARRGMGRMVFWSLVLMAVGYVLHMLVDSAVTPFIPRDAPAWYMWCGCAVFMAITYSLVRTLEKNRIHIKL